MYADMFYWRYFSSPEHFLAQQATRHSVREEEISNCVVGNWSCSLAGFSLWRSEELKREGEVGLPNVLQSSSVLEGGRGKIEWVMQQNGLLRCQSWLKFWILMGYWSGIPPYQAIPGLSKGKDVCTSKLLALEVFSEVSITPLSLTLFRK